VQRSPLQDKEAKQMGDDISRVDPMEAKKKNSETADSLHGEKTVILGEEKSKCYWNDVEFSDGSKVCDNGVTYECHMGLWLKRDNPC